MMGLAYGTIIKHADGGMKEFARHLKCEIGEVWIGRGLPTPKLLSPEGKAGTSSLNC